MKIAASDGREFVLKNDVVSGDFIIKEDQKDIITTHADTAVRPVVDRTESRICIVIPGRRLKIIDTQISIEFANKSLLFH